MVFQTKRVSDPLEDRVKTRILSSYASSSGSDHHVDDDNGGLPSSFLDFELESKPEPVSGCGGEDNTSVDHNPDDHDHVTQCLHALKTVHDHLLNRPQNHPDRTFLPRLRSIVTNAAAAESLSGSGLRRVMARLRRAGYNAGLCKSKWGPSVGLTSSGSYEYVDVEHAGARYIVDLDFRAQFAVARATEEYERVVGLLPEVVVGRAEEVEEVVAAVEVAARRELKGRGLSVPPWRKRRYVFAKWFGPYKRTTKAVAGGGDSGSGGGGGGGEVKCRRVGFEMGGH